MELQELFKESFDKGTIELTIKQLIHNDVENEEVIHHHHIGEKALSAASIQIKEQDAKGGVVHYQRQFSDMPFVSFYSSALLDLFFINRYFGKISRVNCDSKGTDKSRQLFMTIRLANQVIVQYTLNSLQGLPQSFKFDFSSRGYNLDFDTQVQTPMVLNSNVVIDEEVETTLSKEDLSELENLLTIFSQSMKGGN